MPGVYQDTSAGMFTIIEDVNKKFLERVLPPGTGLVGDTRFEQMGWGPLSRMLVMVSKTRPSPLVDQSTIDRYYPGSQRPDQQETLAGWRRLLRQHFGLEVRRGSTGRRHDQ